MGVPLRDRLRRILARGTGSQQQGSEDARGDYPSCCSVSTCTPTSESGQSRFFAALERGPGSSQKRLTTAVLFDARPPRRMAAGRSACGPDDTDQPATSDRIRQSDFGARRDAAGFTGIAKANRAQHIAASTSVATADQQILQLAGRRSATGVVESLRRPSALRATAIRIEAPAVPVALARRTTEPTFSLNDGTFAKRRMLGRQRNAATEAAASSVVVPSAQTETGKRGARSRVAVRSGRVIWSHAAADGR